MPQIKIFTLGCKLNQLESEAFSEQLAVSSEQCSDSKDKSKPSIIIVNTCTVTSKADQKARRVIRKALRDYPEATVIVTGCYAVLEKEKLEELFLTETQSSQRLFVLNKEEVLNYLNNYSRSFVSFDDKFQFFPEKFSKHTRSFLKIQDGCDNHCTYCRIRLARGSSVSLPHEQVLERLKILEANYAETVLTGVNICQYASASLRLGEMIDYLLANTNKIAIRLSSLDPQFVVDSLLTVPKVRAHCSLLTDRIRPHFHLSIQSCSAKILQRMGRAYNAETIEKAVALLRGAKDDPFLACDIITGFPGETEEDFMETYELCKKLQFAWIHVFPYSKRPGTAAAEFKENVQESEITRRVNLLTDLAWQGRKQYIKRWLGRETETIIQVAGNREQGTGEERKKREQGAGSSEQRAVYGLSENYLKVLVKCEGELSKPGTVIRCKLIEESPDFKNFDVVATY